MITRTFISRFHVAIMMEGAFIPTGTTSSAGANVSPKSCAIVAFEANATPARARGVDPKHEPIAEVKMREKGQVPQIDKSRTARAQRLREQGVDDPVFAMLANRQAAVRATYTRSITKPSVSPSAADQLVAKSLEQFVETMPPAEPNSVRAIRLASEKDAEPVASAPVRAPIRIPDVLASRVDIGIDRLEALHERLTSPEAQSKSVSDVKATANGPPSYVANRIRDLVGRSRARAGPDDDPDRAGTLSDRFRALTEKISEPSQPIDLSRHDEIVRQAEERDRERLGRDRAKDRDGPGR